MCVCVYIYNVCFSANSYHEFFVQSQSRRDVNLTAELHLMTNTIRRLELCCTRRSGCISLTYFPSVSIWPCSMNCTVRQIVVRAMEKKVQQEEKASNIEADYFLC